jgi:membrane associated rhomboid family serine protease
MARCDVCGSEESMPYQCRHCGGTFCADHRLPEAHDCPGLENWGDPDGVFDSGFDATVETGSGQSEGLTHRVTGAVDTGPGSMFGYFRGNMTYVFLGVMWITFLFQFIVFPFIAGFGPRTDVWQGLFVLSPQHPEYVWTWVTSIFAHGGLSHIALNSIVIYFFGRLVERYVGSRDFALLFLGSGVIAGLGQMLIMMAQGNPTGSLGASGAGLAIMGVLTILNPGLRVYLYFIVPVPIWIITVFYAGISAAGIIGIDLLGGNTAHAAHLVGLLIGLWYGQRVKDRIRLPSQLQFGGGGRGGPGGPGGPGRRRGPF